MDRALARVVLAAALCLAFCLVTSAAAHADGGYIGSDGGYARSDIWICSDRYRSECTVPRSFGDVVSIVVVAAINMLLGLTAARWQTIRRRRADGSGASAGLRGDDWYGLAGIRDADPDFDTDAFVRWAETAVLFIKRAYADGDPARAQLLLAPALRQAWERQPPRSDSSSDGPGPAGLTVREARVTLGQHSAESDVIEVAFEYDDPPGAPDRKRRCTEVWRFQRHVDHGVTSDWTVAGVEAAAGERS